MEKLDGLESSEKTNTSLGDRLWSQPVHQEGDTIG